MTKAKKQRSSRRSGQQERTTAELITLGISVFLLVGLLALLIGNELRRGDARAGIKVTPRYSDAFERDGSWYLPVDVTNSGDEPTDQVRVDIVRPIEGELPEVADLSFTFVAGDEQVSGWAIFDEKPTPANTEVDEISYTEP